MTVRLFDWRDIPTLHRCRNQSIFLDSALVLTRGPLLVPGALVSYLAPTVGVFTCVLEGAKADHQPLIGQFIHTPGSQFAHLTFLAPGLALESDGVVFLLDYMVTLTGERGALRLLADVDESTQAFDALRKVGFAIFSRQRIWKLNAQPTASRLSGLWRVATNSDLIAIRLLYNNLVPGLVQQVEPYVVQRPHGLVYYDKGNLQAYVELRYGLRGIWAQPFIHPDAQAIPEHLVDLFRNIPVRFSRPVYVCVRSYQSWLELAIEALGAEAGPQQAVMVKHLAIGQKALRPLALPALEGGQAEVTAPMARSESK